MRKCPSFVPHSFWCTLIMFMIVSPIWFTAHAVDLDGVQLPATQSVGGKTLYLNGYGLRTYSILGVHIYAASLYLEHLSSNPE